MLVTVEIFGVESQQVGNAMAIHRRDKSRVVRIAAENRLLLTSARSRKVRSSLISENVSRS